MNKVENSLKWSLIIVALFFTLSIVIVLISPRFIDASWMSPSSPYQVQMYEKLDPFIYISKASISEQDPRHVEHVYNQRDLFAYMESDRIKIISEDALAGYITPKDSSKIRLTRQLLFLRSIENKDEDFRGDVFELYDPHLSEAFICCIQGGTMDHWADGNDIEWIDPLEKVDGGQLFVKNPFEYRITKIGDRFVYDPEGAPISSLEELTKSLQFRSRKSYIEEGERIYAIEGCWYCHTDQTRTLVQDTVLNGTDSYPAPPSSANEYIYQSVTFPGTRRIGPDISRTGVKRPSRDWHKSHFWCPTTVVSGSLMPSFRHFFEENPHASDTIVGTPNEQFEAIYQYMMTKGTRITPPTQGWWIGKDPVKTKELIERRHAN